MLTAIMLCVPQYELYCILHVGTLTMLEKAAERLNVPQTLSVDDYGAEELYHPTQAQHSSMKLTQCPTTHN